MTFIGPRPDTPVGSAAYTDEEKIILTVRPGVTGYNQAVNRNSVLTKEKLKNISTIRWRGSVNIYGCCVFWKSFGYFNDSDCGSASWILCSKRI